MDLSELIERVEKLGGPDRNVDRIISCEVWYDCPHHTSIAMRDEWDVERFTSSIDAAMALKDRLLPDMRVENLSEWEDKLLRSRGPWTCDLVENYRDFPSARRAKCQHAQTPALALVLATLRAYAAVKKEAP